MLKRFIIDTVWKSTAGKAILAAIAVTTVSTVGVLAYGNATANSGSKVPSSAALVKEDSTVSTSTDSAVKAAIDKINKATDSAVSRVNEAADSAVSAVQQKASDVKKESSSAPQSSSSQNSSSDSSSTVIHKAVRKPSTPPPDPGNHY